LTYVEGDAAGFERQRIGDKFAYRTSSGRRLGDRGHLARIRGLAIPPAWSDVWICADPRGHIQATGRDERGRKQYRYHDEFRESRERAKYEHLAAFARALPAIRERVRRDLGLSGLTREKVIATIIDLLEQTLIRVGNDDYARDNKSYGLTTLKNGHITVQGAELRFLFKGKSGKVWRLKVRNRRVAKVVRACQDLPGQRLFQYADGEGAIHTITSTDVNLYLREVSGLDISAKDFRTWAGTVQAAIALQRAGAPESGRDAKLKLKLALEQVAGRLGNTISICRKCYVHPQIIESFQDGGLSEVLQKAGEREGLTKAEAAVLAFLSGEKAPARIAA
jgi:DNA topoisomerase-1